MERVGVWGLENLIFPYEDPESPIYTYVAVLKIQYSVWGVIENVDMGHP